MTETDFTYIIDTFFALFSMVLIIFMVPGFAMLEAGLVRTKNVSSVLTVNTMIYSVASLTFLLVGYTVAFGSWENTSMSIWAAVPASNIPLVVLGALLLWIGWFGFNGGSVGSISSVENANAVAKTIMNTNTAGLSGALIAGIIMYIRYKLLDITMILNGALGGLVAITAGPDLYDMYTPILIGVIGGALVVFAVPTFDKFKLDDPVGALSVHLINGIWGTLAVGIFIDEVSFVDQLKGVVLVGVFAFVSSFIVIYLINMFVKFRAEDDVQVEGLDVNEVGVEAYPEFKRAI